MARPHAALDADWLGACRRAVAGLRAMLAAHPDDRRARASRPAPAARAATARW